jgi:CDP-glycerol glycerophosphotransferase
MFDFGLTGRPILHLAWDLANYRDNLRGFYLDLTEIAPGPILETGDELAEALLQLPTVVQQYAGRYEQFRTRFGSLEDGQAAARVWNHVAASP